MYVYTLVYTHTPFISIIITAVILSLQVHSSDIEKGQSALSTVDVVLHKKLIIVTTKKDKKATYILCKKYKRCNIVLAMLSHSINAVSVLDKWINQSSIINLD